jgi:hypothetical protein
MDIEYNSLIHNQTWKLVELIDQLWVVNGCLSKSTTQMEPLFSLKLDSSQEGSLNVRELIFPKHFL